MKITNYWLILGVSALALSGLFTIPLMVGRTSNLLPQGFFDPSLIIHVNLDVLVWLLSITVSHFNTQKKIHSPIPFFFAAAGIALIALSPFSGSGAAYQNNYIPIFDNSLFKAGIALFLAAVAFESITTVFSAAEYKIKTVAILIICAFAAFFYSYNSIIDKTSNQYLYEYMFWGGGHIMQFAYVQMMLLAWLVLADKGGVKIPGSQRVIYFIFSLPVIFAVIFSIFIYASVGIESNEYKEMFTEQMIFGASIAAIPMLFLVAAGLIINRSFNLYSITLMVSVLLFIGGGVLGNTASQMMIDGETTVIPAHYHFANVAITVALMGYVYSRLNLKKTKWAGWQIIIYSIGQVFYFSGMAIFGKHGAARKTAGLEGINMDPHAKEFLAHFMEGVGGLGLIGGILFILIVFQALRKRHHLADNH